MAVFLGQKMKGTMEPYDPTTMQLFYGVPELEQNLVWKPIDEDPSLFLNSYDQWSNTNKTTRILIRYNKKIKK